jgi:hypothetical protein
MVDLVQSLKFKPLIGHSIAFSYLIAACVLLLFYGEFDEQQVNV